MTEMEFNDEFREMFLDVIENHFDFTIEGGGEQAGYLVERIVKSGYEEEFALMIFSLARFCSVTVDALAGTEYRMLMLMELMSETYGQ